MFAAGFAPRNWSYCNGNLLSIATNSALFSLLGTTYGGDGRVTFGLPDFRSRTAVGTGQNSSTQLGEMGGTEAVTLIGPEMPGHTHTVTGNVNAKASTSGGDETNPNGAYMAASPNLYTTTANSSMGAVTTPVTCGIGGSSMPHNNLQPSLGMNYIICLYGIYPSRN